MGGYRSNLEGFTATIEYLALAPVILPVAGALIALALQVL